MLGLNSNVYLMLYAVSIVAAYIAVRRGWVRMAGGAVVGSMVSSLIVFLYSLTRGNGLLQAIIVALSMGIVFTVTGVVIASFFRMMDVQQAAKASAATVPAPDAEMLATPNTTRA
jgi:predicted lipid-binding transport protein (Tim44 family)